MPLVNLYPKTTEVERRLVEDLDRIRELFKRYLWHVWEIPVHDAIINLHKCTIAGVPDQYASDVVVLLETNPSLVLEERSDELCKLLAEALGRHHIFSTMSVEIWVRFIPGSWTLMEYGQIKDWVGHTQFVPHKGVSRNE